VAAVKERLCQYLSTQVPHDPYLAIVDRFPLPIYQFARAYCCHRFTGQAA
jgi:hypothetical protein